MTALDKKLFRDLWQMKGQSVAIALVIASGLAMFVMSFAALDSLTRSRDAYYERYRFADVFVMLKRAPDSLKERIAEIPGIARLETRVVRDVNLDVPNMVEPAVGRLISLPETRRPALNDVHLRSGRYIEPNRPGEVLVAEAFAVAHGFELGDSVTAIINGRKKKLEIVGVALSPEYVMQVPPGGMWPDDKRFGVFWMGEKELEAAFDMTGAFNDVALQLMPGASEADVIDRLNNLIEPYGGLDAHGREDQFSNRMLADELRGLRGMVSIIPAVFLGVAAFLLNVVLNRVITLQRGEIGMLKAFGYSRFEVGLHFLKLALLITLAGSAVGMVAGLLLGRGLSGIYAEFYRFPVIEFDAQIGPMMIGLLVSCVAATVGVFGAMRQAALLPPAEAMHPEPPVSYRMTVVERLGFQRWLGQAARMILRNLERRPFKAGLSVLGISLAVAILVVGSFSEDAFNYMMDFQFKVAQRQSMTATFVEARGWDALHEAAHLPGVMQVEPFRSLPVRLRSGHRSRRLGIMGLMEDPQLFRLLNDKEEAVALPPDGLMLSEKLAEVLHIGPGDTVTVELLEGERTVRQVPVRGLVREYSGMTAYMNLTALNRLARQGDNISGVHLLADSSQTDDLYRTLKNTPLVAGVTSREGALKGFSDTIAENMAQMRDFFIFFSVIIAFGVVYNSARISLSERSRELATLRVIGFRRSEISAILLGELAILTFVAIPAGLLMGYGLAAWMTLSLDTELYRIPLVVDRSTFGMAALVTISAATISGLVVRRKLDHLDLIAVLKSRE